MISGNGDVGNVKYYNGKFDAYQRTYVLMGFKLDARYLYYYLKESMPKRARDMLNGSAVPYIKLNCITDFDISYPQDIEEQKKIAQVLSDLDELANLHNLKVAELVKMKESLMDNKSGIIEDERNKQENNEWITVKVGDCLEYEQPTKYIVESTDYNDNYAIPVLTANKSFILGYTNEEFGIYNKGDVIIFDDFTCDCKYVDFKFKVKSGAMKLLTPKDGIDLKFMYYMLKTLNVDTTAHKRYYIQDVAEREIEIPKSITEQKRIAKVLTEYDNMVASQEQLISIIQRERVYASSSSDNHQSPKWRTVKLEELVEICDNKRKSVTKSDRTSGEYPYYGGGGIQDYVDSYIFDGDYILLGEDGAPFFDKSRRVAFSVHNKFWANNHIHVLKAKENVDQDYLTYYLNTVNYELYVSNGVVPKLNQSSMRNIEIEIPESIEEQKRIASILISYDSMISSQEKLIELIQREREFMRQAPQTILKMLSGKQSS